MINFTDINLRYKKKILLTNTSMQANTGEITLIKGKSGCGKTSLLYELCLVTKTCGKYIFDNMDVSNFSSNKKAKIRREKIGYVMQNSRLKEDMSVSENIKYYARLNGINFDEEKITILLNKLKLEDLADKLIYKLSGGQRQRVAVACALAKHPKLLLLDEPTSQLDYQNEQLLMKWLREIAIEQSICIIISTHHELDDYADRVYYFKNYQLQLIKDTSKEEKVISSPATQRNGWIINNFIMHINLDHWYYVKLLCLLIMVPVIATIINQGVNYYFEKQKNIYEDSAQKEIYSDEFILQKVTLDNNATVIIFFYYQQNNIDDYLFQNYNQDGCYVSQSLVNYYEKDLRNWEITFILNNKSYSSKIRGVIKNSPINMIEGEMYVIIPITEYCNITQQTPVFFVDTIDELMLYEDRIVFETDYIILQQYQELNQFSNSVDFIITICLIIISIVFSMFYCYSQRVNWAFQYFDGYSKQSIILLNIFELLIINTIIIFISSLFVNYFNIILFIQNSIIFEIIFILSLIIFIITISFKKIIRF